MGEMMYADEVYAIQGAIFEVYKTIGNMWLEEVYQQCLEIELEARKTFGVFSGNFVSAAATYPKG